MMKWNANHFYIHDSTCHNRFLTEYLKPEAEQLEQEGLLDQYFYIVYWQGGNHIRFRYKSSDPATVERRMAAGFKSFLESYEPKYVLPEKTYYEIYSHNKEQVEDLTFVPDRSFRRMAYEPETERYGGADSLPYCERIFTLSSKYTLKIREEAGSSMIRRIIGGLDMFALAVKGMKNPENFLRGYRQYWSDFAPAKGKQLISAEELSMKYENRFRSLMQDADPFYKGWENGIRENMQKACECQTAYPDADTARHLILASQIHMTDNRLGIVPQLEAMLSEVLLNVCGGN
ncbi:MAG: thiopeptide-type bacteriocin biosynthesis protein [Clostridia bacterium]|nr:thiopeptide-type bacteriocin biosynthesis protein [Clostridia bacterium]